LYILESHIVNSLQIPIRLEEYCRGLFIQLPSNKSVKKGIKKGAIQLNNEITEGSRFLKENDTIQLIELEESPPKPFPLEIEIIYEDEHLAVVNKPSGLVTTGNLFRTLENVIQNQVNVSNLKDALRWPKPVHRLDSPTSGLVIISKSISAHIKLGEMLKQKQITKTYHAIVVGDFPAEISEINLDISEKKCNSKVKKISSEVSLRNDYLSLLELQPITGRTHQLRIHLAEKGFPIVGDIIYSEKGKTLEHKGLFLSAVKLQFLHPIKNEFLEAAIPTPAKFKKLINREKERFFKFSEK